MIVKPEAITGADASHQWTHAVKIGELLVTVSPHSGDWYYAIIADYFDLLARYEPERLKT